MIARMRLVVAICRYWRWTSHSLYLWVLMVRVHKARMGIRMIIKARSSVCSARISCVQRFCRSFVLLVGVCCCSWYRYCRLVMCLQQTLLPTRQLLVLWCAAFYGAYFDHIGIVWSMLSWKLFGEVFEGVFSVALQPSSVWLALLLLLAWRNMLIKVTRALCLFQRFLSIWLGSEIYLALRMRWSVEHHFARANITWMICLFELEFCCSTWRLSDARGRDRLVLGCFWFKAPISRQPPVLREGVGLGWFRCIRVWHFLRVYWCIGLSWVGGGWGIILFESTCSSFKRQFTGRLSLPEYVGSFARALILIVFEGKLLRHLAPEENIGFGHTDLCTVFIVVVVWVPEAGNLTWLGELLGPEVLGGFPWIMHPGNK